MGFLADIVEATRAAISRPDYLEGLPSTAPRRAPSLRAAVSAAGERGALLAEYKRRSPGAREPELPARSIEEFVRLTSGAEVEGYSCLAGGPQFGGRPADVADLSARTSHPVLFKEFVVDPVQVEAAMRAGASAVLLIARLEVEGLLTSSLRELAGAAHARGLEVLLEWHDRAELRRTGGVPADVYGVNVRDLDTLELHRSVAERTIRAATGYRPILGMSGVEGPADARRFWDAGVDGILVGSALARTPDPRALLSSLRRPDRGVSS
jgi:indole-3-glycerol phosphate synthase